MTILREQLLAARSEYQHVRFPGDLSGLLPPARPRQAFYLSRPIRILAGLAAAVLVVFMGREIQLGAALSAPPSLSAIKLDLNRWESAIVSFATPGGLPKKANVVDAMQTITPPETSTLLSAVEKPLYDSGNFIVTIGKDLAHHADALFHLM